MPQPAAFDVVWPQSLTIQACVNLFRAGKRGSVTDRIDLDTKVCAVAVKAPRLRRNAPTGLGLLALSCAIGALALGQPWRKAAAEPKEAPSPPSVEHAYPIAAPHSHAPIAGTVVDAFGTVMRDGKAAAHQMAPTIVPPPAPGKPSDKDGQAKTDTPVDGKGKPLKLTEWAPIDIELGRARCTQILKGLDAVTRPETPFRDGECGSPAPVRLVSVGKNPAVVFDPPALVTCDMVDGLERWVEQSIQPIAKRHLGGPVTKIEVMSDYSCRNALGRAFNRLSEHGKVNALDIRGFTTGQGKSAVVLTGWGKTRRDIEQEVKAQMAAAEAAERIKAEAEKAERAKTGAAVSPTKNGQSPAPGKTDPRAMSQVNGKPAPLPPIPAPHGAGIKPSLVNPAQKQAPPELSPKEIARRNFPPSKHANLEPPKGPLAPGVQKPIEPADPHVAAFLRESHDAACEIFGTTIGPEANERHRNHFHVDMAPRKLHKICDD